MYFPCSLFLQSGIQSGSEVYHSGGYQTRSKKNEKREEGGNPGSWQIPEEEPAYYTQKLSKHQKKKVRNYVILSATVLIH